MYHRAEMNNGVGVLKLAYSVVILVALPSLAIFASKKEVTACYVADLFLVGGVR